jgi:class 3 adenylate cyclase
LNAEDVAERAGVEPGYVGRLVELGILAPQDGRFSDGDTRRVRLMETLERAEIPLDRVAAAMQRGQLSLSFLDLPAYDRFAALSGTTFEGLTKRTGVPFELLSVVRESIGYAEPAPRDRVRADEERIIPLVQLQVESGVRHQVIERWLRVYGECLRRVAETEAEWWAEEVQGGLAQSGMTPAEAMAAAGHDVAQRMEPLMDPALLGIYHGQQEHAWTKNIIDGVESALAAAGVFSRVERPPAICFLDITGYTRLTEERGDEAAVELADRVGRLVRVAAGRHQGKPVKWLGDGVLVHFQRPGPGVEAALDMVDAVREADLPPAHVGLHVGPVLVQDGDYFGSTVNVASRIAGYARPGEILVSRDVVDASDLPGVTFSEIGQVDLKGVAGGVELHIARRSD